MSKTTNKDLMKEIIKLNQNLDTLAKQEGHLPVVLIIKEGGLKKKIITTLNELTKENKRRKIKWN